MQAYLAELNGRSFPTDGKMKLALSRNDIQDAAGPD